MIGGCSQFRGSPDDRRGGGDEDKRLLSHVAFFLMLQSLEDSVKKNYKYFSGR